MLKYLRFMCNPRLFAGVIRLKKNSCSDGFVVFTLNYLIKAYMYNKYIILSVCVSLSQ